jgi:hypothetical protein
MVQRTGVRDFKLKLRTDFSGLQFAWAHGCPKNERNKGTYDDVVWTLSYGDTHLVVRNTMSAALAGRLSER